MLKTVSSSLKVNVNSGNAYSIVLIPEETSLTLTMELCYVHSFLACFPTSMLPQAIMWYIFMWLQKAFLNVAVFLGMYHMRCTRPMLEQDGVFLQPLWTPVRATLVFQMSRLGWVGVINSRAPSVITLFWLQFLLDPVIVMSEHLQIGMISTDFSMGRRVPEVVQFTSTLTFPGAR